jgi:hypothetical protein
MCEVEEGCIYVTTKYRQWIMVENQLEIIFLVCFFLSFLDAMKIVVF